MFDRIVALAGLIVLSPFLVTTAVAVKLTSKGSVFFMQERIGKGGVPFRIVKFRTMTVAPENTAGMQVTVSGNTRITGVGAILRRFKLDEIPHLINVLRGQMRLVGPRPEVAKYVEFYTEQQLHALDVAPGMTDLATLYYRNEAEELATQDDPEAYYIETVLPRKLALNLTYLEKRNFIMDLVIIKLTALVSVLPGGFSNWVREQIRKRYLDGDSA